MDNIFLRRLFFALNIFWIVPLNVIDCEDSISIWKKKKKKKNHNLRNITAFYNELDQMCNTNNIGNLT
jgi:hypothetical protein